MVSEIKNGDKNILDVGCATGYLSKNYKKGNYVVGIDISEKAIGAAKQELNDAYVVDIEKYPWPNQIVNRKYDIILCTELIEHLFSPEELIKYLASLLNLNGKIIISTPNLLVWSNRIKMFLGYYENFDKGHIRMFSYKTLKNLIFNCGLFIEKEDRVIHPKIPQFIGRKLPNAFAYQIVLSVKS